MDEQTGPEPFILLFTLRLPCQRRRRSGSLIPLREKLIRDSKSLGDPICGITMAFAPRVVKQVEVQRGDITARIARP